MANSSLIRCLLVLVALTSARAASAQTPGLTPAAARDSAALKPATKFEAFVPAAGTVSTLGYTDIGRVSGVTVDARVRRSAAGEVRGLLVDIYQSEYRSGRSYVDQDEIPELVRGIDALLAITANPTPMKSFEVRYRTRGELELTAFNESNGKISYVVEAGRGVTARRFLDQRSMQTLRDYFAQAQTALAALPSSSR